MAVQSVESEEEEVTGEGIGESEIAELVPEWGWRRDKGSWFQGQDEHNERSDPLFLDRMMKVAEQQ